MTSLVVVFIIGSPLIKIFSEKNDIRPNQTRWTYRSHCKKIWNANDGWCNYNYWNNFQHFALGGSDKYLCLDRSHICIIKSRILGLLDDILKIKLKNSSGLKSKYKFTGQLIIRLYSFNYFN